MNEPRRLSDRWLQRRVRLHEVLETQVGFHGNASVLEQLGRDRRRWTETEIAETWARAARREGRGDEINHVYVHVPFCKSICHFCNYKRLRPGNKELMRTWLDRVRTTLETVGPSLEGFEFHSLYFGGGTPSLLPAPLIDEVLTVIGERVPLVHNAAKFFEADPAVLDEQKLEVLRRHGIQHVSMGVQTLDASVNAEHDRGAQGSELIAKRVEAIRRAGIRGTSMDFLLGLHGTEPDTIFAEIENSLASYAPRWVDIFFLTPTQRYVDLHFDGSLDKFWAHQRRFADVAVERFSAMCARHGYDMHGDVYDAFILRRRPRAASRLASQVLPFMDRLTDRIRHNPQWLGGVPRRIMNRLKSSEDSPYTYNHLVAEQHLPLNLLGLGSGARTRIYGHAFVEYTDPDDDPSRTGPAEYVGSSTDMGFEARAYMLMTLRDANALSEQKVQQLFGVGLEHLVPEALAAWQQRGVGYVRDGSLRLHPTGRQERGRDLMWLLDDALLESEVARHRNMDLGRDKLMPLFRPLKPGDALAEGLAFGGVDDGALWLEAPGGARTRIRVSPRLDRQTGIELLPEQASSGGDLRRALRRLEKLAQRNGSEEWGIKEVPIISTSAFAASGQHAPAPVGRDRRRRHGGGRYVPEPVIDLESTPAVPLDEAGREKYARDGYVNRVPILSQAEVTRFRQWLELIEAEQSARQGGSWDARDFHPERDNEHPLLDWADELARHPRLLEAVASVLGPNLLVRNVDIFVREAHARDGVEWHRDTASSRPQADRMLTVWLGLNGSRPDNGGMQFVSGSHDTSLPGEAITPDTLTFPPAVIDTIPLAQVVDNEMRPGEASLHHSRLIHRSGGNTTAGRRIGVVLRFLACDVDPEAAHCGVAMLVRGEHDNPSITPRSRVPVSWRA